MLKALLVAFALFLVAEPAYAAAETPQQFNLSRTGAPTPGVAAPVNGALSGIKAFTLSDLQNAAADAAAQVPPDTRHGQCWTALATLVQNQNTNLLPSQLGLASAAQKAFDFQNNYIGHQAWKDAIATSCALTILDLNTTLVSLLGKAGLTLGGTAFALPVL